jgi:hypothetical protein
MLFKVNITISMFWFSLVDIVCTLLVNYMALECESNHILVHLCYEWNLGFMLLDTTNVDELMKKMSYFIKIKFHLNDLILNEFV